MKCTVKVQIVNFLNILFYWEITTEKSHTLCIYLIFLSRRNIYFNTTTQLWWHWQWPIKMKWMLIWSSCNARTLWYSRATNSDTQHAIVSVPCVQHPNEGFSQRERDVGWRWGGGGLEGGGAEMGLHASSGKSLPGVLMRIINRLSMSGSR